ncbi:MAG TPA: hypothetical protein VL793_01650 [Patescibacteria group bacterium]|nr:hypothetical protein [Patescibacteria group bacterium]
MQDQVHTSASPCLQFLRKYFAVAALAGLVLVPGGKGAAAGKPEIDPSYVNGKLYYMIGPRLITNPNPNLYAKSEELYLLVYPINPTGSKTLGALTLPSGYQPNCDPCFHPGLPAQFAYHDHVLTGAPGLGTHGTAGEFKGPWKLILLMYNPEVALDPSFTPITSAADIDSAEAAGVFVPLNPTGPNQFEIETGNVLICPLVSPHA